MSGLGGDPTAGAVAIVPLAGHQAEAEALAGAVVALPPFLPYALSAGGLVRSWEAAAAAPAAAARLRLAVRGGRALGVAWSLPHGAFAVGAYLRFLAVLPAAEGGGLGALLLADFEAASAPLGGWFVLTGGLNAAAQAFYGRHGYRQVGRLPDLVRPGLEERLWWKPRGLGG